jgi:hypothetical protein
MTAETWDPLKALRTLDRYGVRSVVIGGLAARLYGSPSVTNDTDVCYERSRDNLERLAKALRSLRATLRGVEGDVPFRLDAATLEAGDHFTFSTTAGNLDCLGTPSGASDFEGLWSRSDAVDLDGFSVRVASIDDLIEMKRAAGRPKDLIEIEVLGAVRDELEDRHRAERN